MDYHVETCGWKLVPSDGFVLGIHADRCGKVAAVKLLRPQRKTDLCLCEAHLNDFVEKWGLFYKVKLLGPWMEAEVPWDGKGTGA